MVAGLPVLDSVYAQAVEELVEEGVIGWTSFRPDDPDDIYPTLTRTMSVEGDHLRKMRRQIRPRTSSSVQKSRSGGGRTRKTELTALR